MPKTNGSFRKGDGRKRKPKGAINKTTKEAKEMLQYLLFGRMDSIKEALDKLEKDDPGKYIDAITKLFSYVLPKQTEIIPKDEFRIKISFKE